MVILFDTLHGGMQQVIANVEQSSSYIVSANIQ